MAKPPPADPFATALRHHQAGRLGEAEALYRRILAANPRHPGSLHHLGLVAHQSGHHQAACDLIRQAIAVDGNDPACHGNLAAVLMALGRPDGAVAASRRAVALDPRYCDGWANLAAALQAQELLDEALSAWRRVAALQPRAAEIRAAIGEVLRRLGRADEAIAAWREAVALRPDSAVLHYNLGNLYGEAGRLAEAVACYRGAAKHAPDMMEAHYNLANLLVKLGRLDEAVAAYRVAARLAPDFPAVHNNLGRALEGLGRPDEAAAAYRAAIALNPGDGDVHANLGNLLAASGAYGPAAESYRNAVAIQPGNAEAHYNLGNALKDLGRLDESAASYRAAIAVREDYVEAHTNLGTVLMDEGDVAGAIAAYRRAVAAAPEFVHAHSNLLFALCFADDLAPDAVYREHLRYDSMHVKPFAVAARHDNGNDPERPLRVGYLSPDFRRHPGGHALLQMLEFHDRNAVSVFCYNAGTGADDITALSRRHADHWRDCAMASDRELAELIRGDGIDILVECAGHMDGSRLLMCGRWKPAPLQVSFPLYPNTTGVSAIDYRIVDPYFAQPEADCWHRERLIRMPDVHICYRPSRADIDPAPEPPCIADGFVTFGAFNNLAKFGPATIAAFADVLKAVPDSRLMIKWKRLEDAGRQARLRGLFQARGIDSERLVLAGFAADPYTPYRALDIALDTVGVNGGTSTCDALWMGVPVVTRYGDTPFSRVGLCHLTNVGLTELVADSAEAYVATAARLATDAARLAELRHGLRRRFAASPLMDGRRYTRNLEDAFRRIWRRWCAGAEPIAIDLRARASTEG